MAQFYCRRSFTLGEVVIFFAQDWFTNNSSVENHVHSCCNYSSVKHHWFSCLSKSSFRDQPSIWDGWFQALPICSTYTSDEDSDWRKCFKWVETRKESYDQHQNASWFLNELVRIPQNISFFYINLVVISRKCDPLKVVIQSKGSKMWRFSALKLWCKPVFWCRRVFVCMFFLFTLAIENRRKWNFQSWRIFIPNFSETSFAIIFRYQLDITQVERQNQRKWKLFCTKSESICLEISFNDRVSIFLGSHTNYSDVMLTSEIIQKLPFLLWKSLVVKSIIPPATFVSWQTGAFDGANVDATFSFIQSQNHSILVCEPMTICHVDCDFFGALWLAKMICPTGNSNLPTLGSRIPSKVWARRNWQTLTADWEDPNSSAQPDRSQRANSDEPLVPTQPYANREGHVWRKGEQGSQVHSPKAIRESRFQNQ